ncbi:MAG: bifunctional phosphoglucose/phosphomannose isomerase [Chloroflexi bacterium]|nr:bifunctional phosphoglucose/phosphomannose isomerase [Chloroflexota bacterium]
MTSGHALLDDLPDMQGLDPHGMLRHIAGLPNQCQQSWAETADWRLPAALTHPSHLVVAGMGGSAIGGDLLRTWAEPVCPVPITVARGYTLPASVGPSTLVVASSYSGGTEETLAAFADGLRRGARMVAVTCGGPLQTAAAAAGAPWLPIRYPSAPRAALGASLAALLRIAHEASLIASPQADLTEAIDEMTALQEEIGAATPLAANPAKQLAAALHGHTAVIVGAAHLREVARRWKGQINENAKAWAFFDEMPEMNHNSVMAYESLPAVNSSVAVVFLTAAGEHPRHGIRCGATASLLERYGIAHYTVAARGRSTLAQMLTALHFGDYVSFYLAMLYGQDPTDIGTISYIKDVLAKN